MQEQGDEYYLSKVDRLIAGLEEIADNARETSYRPQLKSNHLSKSQNFLTVVGDSFKTDENKGLKSKFSTLIRSYDILSSLSALETQDYPKVTTELDNLFSLVSSLRTAKLSPKGYDNTRFIQIDDSYNTRAQQAIIDLLETTIPPAFRSVDFPDSILPKSLRGKVSEHSILRNYELLINADDQRNEGDQENFMFRHKLISKLLEHESKNIIGEFREVPVFSYALAGNIYSIGAKSGIGLVLENYMTDLISEMNKPQNTLKILSKPEKDPLHSIRLLQKVLKLRETSFLFGRALGYRHGKNINAIEFYNNLNSELHTPATGMIGNLIKLSSRLVRDKKTFLPEAILDGMRSIPKRDFFSQSEISEVMTINEDSDMSTIDFDLLMQGNTEIALNSSLKNFSNIQIQNGFRGKISMVVSQMDNTITGEVIFTSKQNSQMVRTLPFLINIDDDAIGEIDLELIGDGEFDESKQLVRGIINTVFKSHVATIEENREQPIAKVQTTDLTTPQFLTREERKQQYERDKEYKKRKRMSPKKVTNTVVDNVQAKPVERKYVLPQVDYTGLGTDLEQFDQSDILLEEIMDKMAVYLQKISISNSKKMFGKKVVLEKEENIDLRQITVTPRRGQLELRLYFINEEGRFKYQGVYHKHGKNEQDVYIRGLVSRIINELNNN